MEVGPVPDLLPVPVSDVNIDLRMSIDLLPCVSTTQAQTTLTTNDIVISKLTQILSYLRQGTRHKKMKKKDKGKLDDKRAPEADLSIFEDTGDYIPSATSKPSKDKDRHRGRDEDSKSRRHAYFEKPRGDDHQLIEVDT
ncbi:hypothetical protein GOODEAATRI_032045, partial [Goodea atripinnis]